MKVYPDVKNVEEFRQQPEDYQTAVKKIVRSHAINELYGSQVYDEPAIALAPTPYWKWLSCRVAMEEYHHHIRFRELADQIGVKPEEMDTKNKRPLSLFGFDMKTFEEFGVIKAVGDLGEILQVEDLIHCSFVPLRNIARATMPEERFHAQFGHDFCKEFMQKPGGKEKLQQALDRFFPCARHSSDPRARKTTKCCASTASSSARTKTCAATTWRGCACWWRTNSVCGSLRSSWRRSDERRSGRRENQSSSPLA